METAALRTDTDLCTELMCTCVVVSSDYCLNRMLLFCCSYCYYYYY